MGWFVKLERNTKPRQLVQKAVDGYNSVLRVKPSRMRFRMGICNDRYGVLQCHSWWMDSVSGTIGSLLGYVEQYPNTKVPRHTGALNNTGTEYPVFTGGTLIAEVKSQEDITTRRSSYVEASGDILDPPSCGGVSFKMCRTNAKPTTCRYGRRITRLRM